MQSPDFGINLVAAISGNIGLGVTARNIARSLERHGVPFVIADVNHDWGGNLPIGDLQSHVAQYSNELLHPLNLYVLPMSSFETLFQSRPWLLAAGRLHVASLWWEASAVPPAWIENLSRLDAVLAGSSFLSNLMANELVLTPVIEANHPLSLPAGTVADRARFGLPADATVFAASFDPNSDPARKNPIALIQAFQMAFPAGTGNARLAIRMNNAATGFGPPTLEGLTKASAGDGRISYLLEPMDYETVLSFYASSDVYVSLHRGEGLGLGLMESMALGKPVIATAWSGNMSFMSYACGCPVRFRKTPVSGNWNFFKPEFAGAHAFWADPMVDDAAHWMRKLHDDPQLRLRLGAAAKTRIDGYQAEAWNRQWIDDLAALHHAQSFLPRAPGKFSAMTAQ
jgi:hypothetical protein